MAEAGGAAHGPTPNAAGGDGENQTRNNGREGGSGPKPKAMWGGEEEGEARPTPNGWVGGGMALAPGRGAAMQTSVPAPHHA